jgi:hypothetical protein
VVVVVELVLGDGVLEVSLDAGDEFVCFVQWFSGLVVQWFSGSLFQFR